MNKREDMPIIVDDKVYSLDFDNLKDKHTA